MNYLGHAYLSFGNSHVLTGNMIGDFIKGKAYLKTMPAGVAKGISLHRKIDGYADTHPANQRAKLWFRQDYGLYAGAIIDTVYDHFLANDPKHFESEKTLLAFSSKVYEQLGNNSAYFPEMFAKMFPYMHEQNWLYGYRTLSGIHHSLNGLARRAIYMPAPDKAYSTFISHFYELNQCYYEFMDDVVKFVKVELSQ